jgi:NAD(P)-dependent dehydrogenase (short-subunit alcohol dehydrogenase family)
MLLLLEVSTCTVFNKTTKIANKLNLVFPSEMTESLAAGKDGTLDNAISRSIMPLGRFGRPSEMEATVLYLAGPGGAYSSGSITVVDGGRLGTLLGATY